MALAHIALFIDQTPNARQIEALASPLVRVSLTDGMIAADFLGDPTGTGLDMPSQTDRQQEAMGLFFLAAIAPKLPVTSTAAKSWTARDAYG